MYPSMYETATHISEIPESVIHITMNIRKNDGKTDFD